jgi:hypothetical protein
MPLSTLTNNPAKGKLIIVPVKLVLKAIQTATGKLDKLKACLVTHHGNNMENDK